MRLRRAKGIRPRRVCSFYRGNRSSVIRAHCWAEKSICLVAIRVNTNYSVGLVTGSLSLCTKSTKGVSLCGTIVTLFLVGNKDEGEGGLSLHA